MIDSKGVLCNDVQPKQVSGPIAKSPNPAPRSTFQPPMLLHTFTRYNFSTVPLNILEVVELPWLSFSQPSFGLFTPS